MKFHRPSRRAILGGAGAAIALPLLRSLMPREVRAAPQTGRPHRFIGYYVPDGIHMADWTPSAMGAEFALPPILASLEPIRSRALVISGLDNAPARPEQAGDHASGTGGFMTATHIRKSESDIYAGISVDQVIANHYAGTTRFDSLQLGTDGGASTGGCDSGYGCAYTRNISWSGPTSPLPKLTSPAAVFDLLFAGFDPNESAAEAAKRRAYKTSVLDHVATSGENVRGRLSRGDQAKLDEYLTGVRELERRVSDPGAVCEPGQAPNDGEFPDRARQLSDLMALAVQCDMTRVFSFMLGNGGDNRAFNFIGINEGHHELSHHQGNAAIFPKLSAICAWEMEQVSYLLQKLDAIDDGEGRTALDNTTLFFSSEIEDGNSHSHFNMPILLAGGHAGKLITGQHVRYDDHTVADLFLTIAQSTGASIDRFGDDGEQVIAGLNV